jgi:flavin-binding protein dodecin
MGNGQPTRTGSGSASKADTSGGLAKSSNSAAMPLGASGNSNSNTAATTLNGSRKTWKNSELVELQSKAGLVAGALADFQTAKGLIVREEITYTAPSGRVCKAVKLILLVQDVDLVAEKTADGLDFYLVAGES